MPIVNFHLVAGSSTPEQDERLLQRASALYAEVLASPLDRVRAFITLHGPEQFAVGGELVSASGDQAPFFDFIVLDGRPLDQRQQLMRGFTDLLVEVLGVRRERVRGCCRRVPPEDWCIAGEPASELRRTEIEARAAAAGKSA
jgi:4-oxalocrotonate tautomerase